MIISRTGYTGELGFELYFEAAPETAVKIWNAVFDAGKEYSIRPVGLGARDTLRLEMGYCLYGNDIDSTTMPLEAGLGWITKLNKKRIHRTRCPPEGAGKRDKEKACRFYTAGPDNCAPWK